MNNCAGLCQEFLISTENETDPAWELNIQDLPAYITPRSFGGSRIDLRLSAFQGCQDKRMKLQKSQSYE